MDTFANISLIVLCISGPLFFITTIGLGIFLFVQRNSYKSQLSTSDESQYELKISLSSKIEELENKLRVLSNDSMSGIRDYWFVESQNTNYSSEIDVEIKFIYVLLRLLGYERDELKTRVAVQIPVGRQKVAGEADWVVYDKNDNPIMVVEAKRPTEKLSSEVQDQARSYAFALNTPTYITTNGKEVRVV